LTTPGVSSASAKAPRTLVIEQPNYIPWLGYFDLIRQSDVWVWYDDVQFTRRDWRNRNRVGAGGDPVWLTIPVKNKGRRLQPICEVEIDSQRDWARRHLETLRHCYARAPHFAIVEAVLESRLSASTNLLSELVISVNEAICELLDLHPVFLRSSQLELAASSKQERLLEMCRLLGATTYLSGPAASAYLQPQMFAREGIDLRYIRYEYPPYRRGSHPFVPRLSIVDVLAWQGPEATRRLLETQGGSERDHPRQAQ
jgi:hypothetical protein